MKLKYSKRYNKKQAKTRFRASIKQLGQAFHIVKSQTSYSIHDRYSVALPLSVFKFSIKELPHWLFAIWEGGEFDKCLFIADIYDCVDKFKPFSTLVTADRIDVFIEIINEIIENGGYADDVQKSNHEQVKQWQQEANIENLLRHNYIKTYCNTFNEVHGNICKLYIKHGTTNMSPVYYDIIIEQYEDIPTDILETLKLLQDTVDSWAMMIGIVDIDNYQFNYNLAEYNDIK